MLALCTIVKANFDRSEALERIAQSIPDLISTLTSLLGELPMLPPQYPETDVYANALITLALLLPHLPHRGSQVFAPTLSALTRILDAHPDVVPNAFDTLDQYIPAQLLPKRLLDLVDRGLASRSTCITLLVHVLGQLASTSSASTSNLAEQAYTILGTRILDSSGSTPSLLTIRLPVTKSIRRGATPLPVLTILPPMDSTLVSLTLANRLPPTLSRLTALSDRFEQVRAVAHAAFSSKALAEASMWFDAAVAYAKALGRPVCGLMSSRVECLLGVVGREQEATRVASEALEMCSKEHGHYAATVRRDERAKRALDRALGRKKA
ncbi:hypothetical protein BCR44DRAFT_43800 [Catenaria anguillulae PL171]|uniref:Uncharacterized protein n=1 Tax=Catenaria anguillulae PL171 TaxID=765915 RepID=A0A1Y2HN23_9FUNG|nr:hypothetical protein BCR44DRAFT_43800 [Catenaria anguillulae PL171]